jgi:XTP/dITP diphosphohydrolase
MRLVLASNNAKKLIELQSLFGPLGLDIVTQASLGIAEADEPFHTFVENALVKARHAAQQSGSAAIADDSGLSVQALAGAPGVLSARYATLFGRPKGDDENNRVLLEQLRGQTDRTARFVCALVAVRSSEDPEPLIAMGRWEGQVLSEARGEGGFGYDPLLFIPGLNASVAELSAAQKNRHSHRALAAQDLLRQMREVWHLG